MTTVPADGRGLPAARIATRLPARIAAGLAVLSALVHLLLLDASALGALAMAVMAVACLPCAWHLCRSPTVAVWAATAAADAAMLGVHASMRWVPGGHHHMAAAGTEGLGRLGISLVLVQLLVSGAMLLRASARRRRAGIDDADGTRVASAVRPTRPATGRWSDPR